MPTIILRGSSDGIDPVIDIDGEARHFTGSYQFEYLDNVGHNIAQEAPEAIATAVLALA